MSATASVEIDADTKAAKFNFAIPKGVGIEKIEFTSSTGGDTAGIAGATDTYTITYTDGSTATYDVTNGADGAVISDTEIRDDRTWSSKQITGGVANVPVTSIGSVENTTNFGLGSANHFYTVKNGVCYFQLYLLVKTPAGTMTIVRQGLPKPLDGQIQYWAFPPYNGAADLTPLRFAIEANGQAKAAFGTTNGQYMCHGSYPVA